MSSAAVRSREVRVEKLAIELDDIVALDKTCF